MEVEFALDMKLVQYADQKALSLYIPHDLSSAWCLYLILLEQGYVKHLRVNTKSAGKSVGLVIARGKKTTMSIDGLLKVEMDENALQYACSFFLKYFKDKMAEVDHIDIETSSGDYFILHAERYYPSMTPQEAKKRFDL